ncbi:MAG: hypothetical protein ACI9N9_002827, partial [Enterobacterales bacterium]
KNVNIAALDIEHTKDKPESWFNSLMPTFSKRLFGNW